MFGKSEKRIQVELVTPVSITMPNCTISPHAAEPSPSVKKVDRDFAFKLLACFTIFLQAALIVYGYLELSAFYEQFGIYTSELELGTPTILTAGYSYSFSSIMSLVDDIPYVGPIVPGVMFIAVALSFVSLLLSGVTKVGDIIEKGTVGGIFLLFLFIAPILGVIHGLERGKTGLTKTTKMDMSAGVSKEYSIVTKEGTRLTGQLVVADTKSTFLLVDNTVYKVDNKTNRVMRETVLTPKTQKID